MLEQDGAHIVCQITLPFLLPERMDHVRKERVRELRSLPFQVKIELRREDPVVYVEVKLNNCVRDHRLRWVFAHSSKARSSISDSAFDLVERPALTDPRPEQINTQPMRNLLTVPYEDQACLTVYSASSQEYEVYNRHREGYAALTLLRSVEAVNRSDLLTKDDTAVGIGVGWWTESNEMQQELVLPLAFRIDAPSDSRNDWMKQAQLYQYPVEAISELAEGDQPAVCSGISLSGEGVLSMVRRPFRKEYTEIRLFNLEGKETQAALHLPWPVKKAEYVSLSGEEMGVCANDTENIAVTLPAHKIVTVRLWP